MNVVKIMGGLGNQLFQYALAKHLEHYDSIGLDITYYDSEINHNGDVPHREFLLPCFVDDLVYAEQENRPRVNQWEYDKNRAYTDSWFFGDWQKASFFADADLKLRLKDEYITKGARVITRALQDENSVAIHIRRRDYINLGWTLDLDYYDRAIERIKSLTPNPVFYLFSDDIAWCIDNLEFDFKFYVCYDELIDFWLMSKCKHNIIANSSYSFWSAYLNENPDKVVIYPKNWICSANPTEGLEWEGV